MPCQSVIQTDVGGAIDEIGQQFTVHGATTESVTEQVKPLPYADHIASIQESLDLITRLRIARQALKKSLVVKDLPLDLLTNLANIDHSFAP